MRSKRNKAYIDNLVDNRFCVYVYIDSVYIWIKNSLYTSTHLSMFVIGNCCDCYLLENGFIYLVAQ